MIGDPTLSIVGDERRLFQVLLNLVANAVKFTEQGGVRVLIELTPDEEHRTCRTCIRVTDTGIGIEPEKLEMIFDSFAQAEGSAARGCGGRGLGLAIARGVTRRMGGELLVESKPGQGSVFTVDLTLPLADVAAREEVA
ncbi:MAG: hypothetical protein GY778_21495 [bacterium]|nr:hypothetical protein [bacterium]